VTLRITKNNIPLCELSQQLNLPSPKPPPTEKKAIYYEELYRKRKERYDILAKQIRAYGFTIATSGELKGGPKEQLPPTMPEGLLVT
jgi:hypothetical protein